MTKPKSPGPEALYLGRQNEHTTQRQHMLARLESPEAAGYSARSVEGYRERLLPFMTWCEERGLLYAPQISWRCWKRTSAIFAATARPTGTRWRWAGSLTA
nr:site-specific tyrosine recombinase XerC [Escherichia coli]